VLVLLISAVPYHYVAYITINKLLADFFLNFYIKNNYRRISGIQYTKNNKHFSPHHELLLYLLHFAKFLLNEHGMVWYAASDT